MYKYIFILFLVPFLVCAGTKADHNLKLKMGVSPDYPPFEFKSEGVIKGFDIDFARKIADEVGFELEIVELEYSSLIPALKSKKIDFIISSVSMNEERLKEVDFSMNYYDSSFALIFNKKDKFSSIKDLAGKAIGAQMGSTMEEYLKNLENKDFQILTLANNNSLMQQLILDRINGLVVEDVQADSFIQKNPNLSYFIIDDAKESYAVAFRKQSKLVNQFNQAIYKLKKNDELKILRDKWFKHEGNSNSVWYYSLINIPKGIFITIKYAVISTIIGFIIGSILAIFKVLDIKILSIIASVYTSVFRGTPLLVQLSLIYFAIPALFEIELSIFAAGIITFSLNSGAYVSEIIKAGINSVDKGQSEACMSLNISYYSKMKDIILPQAIKNILPSLANEVINLLKESAIISIIGEEDLMRRAQLIAAEKYSFIEPMLVAAICYYLLVLFFASLTKKLEQRLNKY